MVLASQANVRYTLNMELDDSTIEELRTMLDWFREIRPLVRPSGDTQTPYVKIANAHFDTTDIYTNTVITIDGSGASGWQWPIKIADPYGSATQTKCIGCDALNQTGDVLCLNCRAVLGFFGKLRFESTSGRSVEQNWERLLSLADDDGALGMLEILTREGVARYMEGEIARLRDAHNRADGEGRGGEEPERGS